MDEAYRTGALIFSEALVDGAKYTLEEAIDRYNLLQMEAKNWVEKVDHARACLQESTDKLLTLIAALIELKPSVSIEYLLLLERQYEEAENDFMHFWERLSDAQEAHLNHEGVFHLSWIAQMMGFKQNVDMYEYDQSRSQDANVSDALMEQFIALLDGCAYSTPIEQGLYTCYKEEQLPRRYYKLTIRPFEKMIISQSSWQTWAGFKAALEAVSEELREKFMTHSPAYHTYMRAQKTQAQYTIEKSARYLEEGVNKATHKLSNGAKKITAYGSSALAIKKNSQELAIIETDIF